MPTIALGTSSSVSLSAGQQLRVSGVGAAAAGVGTRYGQIMGIAGSATIGPFEGAVLVSLSATGTALEYTTDVAAIPDSVEGLASGGGGGSVSIPFSSSVSFTRNAMMGRRDITGPLAFTVDSAGAVAGSTVSVLLVSDGTNVPTFSGFSEWATSFGYDNSQAGLVNFVEFWWDGVAARYAVSQPAVNTPLPMPDTTPPAFVSAVVADATPTKIVLTYGEALSASLTGSITVGGVARTVVSQTVVASTVEVVVNTPYANGDTITVTVPSGCVKDAAGNAANALTAQAVTNNVGASGATGTILTLSGLTNLTVSSDVYTGGTATSFGAYGRGGALTLAGDGWVSVDWASASNGAVVVGFDAANTVDWNANFPDFYLRLSTASSTLFRGSNSSSDTSVGATISAASTARYRLRRASGTVTIDESNDSGNSWTTRYTFAGTSTGTLYVWVATITGNAIYRPRQVGFA